MERREWRKNLDSDRCKRRYRLRDEAEWIEVDVPDLRIVDEESVEAGRAEFQRRNHAAPSTPHAAANRAKHLLSGLIICGACGARYTLSGKDYYRCARNHERGTCGISKSVKTSVVEAAVLGALQRELLTFDLAKLFTGEFRREVDRLTRTGEQSEDAARERLAELETEIENLARNFLAGAVSPTLIP